MDILRNLRRLETRLANSVEGTAQKFAQPASLEPLEIAHAIVAAVEQRVEPAGRGKYVFPFSHIRIVIEAASRETQARFEAVLACEPSLEDRIAERLRVCGCPNDPDIKVAFADHSESQWTNAGFNVEFERVSENTCRTLKLTVGHGTADKSAYVFAASRINLGRGPEVRDNRNRLMRTNHVSFIDTGDELNLTVSRNHAHIECAAISGEYRLCDDRSAHGTCIVRNGRTIGVPSGPRGVRLLTGDEIVLGETTLHVEIETPSDS